MDSKYVVLKRDTWEAFKSVVGSSALNTWDKLFVLDDAEVIRCKDLTSGPIFFLYSNLLHSFMDVDPNMSEGTKASLIAAADHFHEAGLKASTWPGRRLPD